MGWAVSNMGSTDNTHRGGQLQGKASEEQEGAEEILNTQQAQSACPEAEQVRGGAENQRRSQGPLWGTIPHLLEKEVPVPNRIAETQIWCHLENYQSRTGVCRVKQ